MSSITIFCHSLNLVTSKNFFIYQLFFSFQKDDLPIVTLPDGKVAGTLQSSGHNKTFYAFFQIPYALPPEGPLRFKVCTKYNKM